MHCENCGTKLADTAKFCSKCGEPVATHAADDIALSCPKCNQKLVVQASMQGTENICPSCNNVIKVPGKLKPVTPKNSSKWNDSDVKNRGNVVNSNNNKWAVIVSLPAAMISVTLIAAVFAMAAESGIHGEKVLTARIMMILAMLTGAGAVWLGILGIRKGYTMIAAIAGIILGSLSLLVSALFFCASLTSPS